MLKRRGQEVIEYLLANLVQGQTELNGADFQRDPSQIAVTYSSSHCSLNYPLGIVGVSAAAPKVILNRVYEENGSNKLHEASVDTFLYSDATTANLDPSHHT
jgi:hypothetical protein